MATSETPRQRFAVAMSKREPELGDTYPEMVVLVGGTEDEAYAKAVAANTFPEHQVTGITREGARDA